MERLRCSKNSTDWKTLLDIQTKMLFVSDFEMANPKWQFNVHCSIEWLKNAPERYRNLFKEEFMFQALASQPE